MHEPLICHILIGPPGSGKSTFAAQLAKLGNYQIVATDAIRQQLYGDEIIQGKWSEVEARVIGEIESAIASSCAIVYDATNAKRPYRMALLTQLKNLSENVQWIGWHLQTSLTTCKAWNQNRLRQVPETVIEEMFYALQKFPPVVAEGFTTINSIDISDPKFTWQTIATKINSLSRRQINRNNRTKHSQIKLHAYSRLLDFERLLHLIALIIQYPTLGNLQHTNPNLLVKILGEATNFSSSLAEITAIISKLKGAIYADSQALAKDLQWLETYGFISSGKLPIYSQLPEIQLEKVEDYNIVTHTYSDLEPFLRLVNTIRFILHHPFLPNTGEGHLKTLVTALRENQIIDYNYLDRVRKDMEKVLKPYQILPDFPLRNGYFAGTGILSRYELQKVFTVIQSQAQSLEDPVALASYETFQERIALSNLGITDTYPVRTIGTHCIINSEFVHPSALAKNLEKLEAAILQGELLELNRISGCATFPGDEHCFFLAWPLQIVFHNLGWYLGFECASGKHIGLFRFERLDRLFIGKPQNQVREREIQLKSLQKLQKLYTASAGIFLGNNAQMQQQFLSSEAGEKANVEVMVELWFNDDKFRFISEGTKRFPSSQMQMSPPLGGSKLNYPKSIFCLAKTKDSQFPNRFRVKLPKWSLNDVNLLRWIVGFAGNVKVKQPIELINKIKEIGTAITEVYSDLV